MKTLRKLENHCLAAVGAALLAALAAPALAGDVAGRDVTVQYADLAIETEAGARKLLGRIEKAAQRICAPLNHGSLPSRANEQKCRTEVTAAAVIKVNHPMLQAAFDRARGARPSVASLGR